MDQTTQTLTARAEEALAAWKRRQAHEHDQGLERAETTHMVGLYELLVAMAKEIDTPL